ncbi:MAG: FHA domain-containing protein [Planctomycetota bacterium]|nr:MAG: FHA domain-containing protein [Planctomycetota bacterium]
MEDQLVALLRFASGQTQPLRLVVRDARGELVQRKEIDAPFAIIGRGSNCDLHIDEEVVAYRHAYLQVFANRVACIDLISTNGIAIQPPAPTHWISSEHRFRIGTHWVQLEGDWLADPTVPSPMEFKARDEQRIEFGVLPKAELELLNTSAKGRMWPINRVVTLIGRDEKCRITIPDERISRVHCVLLLLPSGLWVIDLLGKGGIKVNSQPVRCSALPEGSQLQIGDYLVAVHYPELQQAPMVVTSPLPPPPQSIGKGSVEFRTSQNRLFKVETWGDTLIVIPIGADSGGYKYHDIHTEAGRINELIIGHGYRKLIVDCSQTRLVGSLMIDAITGFLRKATDKAVFCGASPEMHQSLTDLQLLRIWPLYATRHDALLAIYS